VPLPCASCILSISQELVSLLTSDQASRESSLVLSTALPRLLQKTGLKDSTEASVSRSLELSSTVLHTLECSILPKKLSSRMQVSSSSGSLPKL
jgi:hypothetical protein